MQSEGVAKKPNGCIGAQKHHIALHNCGHVKLMQFGLQIRALTWLFAVSAS